MHARTALAPPAHKGQTQKLTCSTRPPSRLAPRSGRSIRSLRWFFILSCGLLLLIAAGLVSQGVVFFTDAGLFGTLFPYEVRWALGSVVCA